MAGAADGVRGRVVGVGSRSGGLGYGAPGVDAAAIDEALSRLEALPEWVRESSGSRQDMARLKNMTSGFIGRFASAAFEATRAASATAVLTRYSGDVVVPEDTRLEIAVLKCLAATFVMESDLRQPLYQQQRELLLELIAELSRTGEQHLEPMFAADFLAAENDDVRLRVVIDQVASLTDRSAIALHESLLGGARTLL